MDSGQAAIDLAALDAHLSTPGSIGGLSHLLYCHDIRPGVGGERSGRLESRLDRARRELHRPAVESNYPIIFGRKQSKRKNCVMDVQVKQRPISGSEFPAPNNTP